MHPSINLITFIKLNEISITLHGTVLINKIDIEKSKMKTYQDLANLFPKLILKKAMASWKCVYYFKDMMDKSSKSETLQGQTSAIQIQYKLEDNTNIKNLTSANFLSLNHFSVIAGFWKVICCCLQ